MRGAQCPPPPLVGRAFQMRSVSKKPIAATGIMSAFSATSVGIALVALTESMRKDVRSTGLAILYAVVVAIFGGMAQPMVAWIMKLTGDPMAPAWYLMAAAAIGIAAMALLKETKPEPLDDEDIAVASLA